MSSFCIVLLKLIVFFGHYHYSSSNELRLELAIPSGKLGQLLLSHFTPRDVPRHATSYSMAADPGLHDNSGPG